METVNPQEKLSKEEREQVQETITQHHDESKPIHIVVIGETGVGKSTKCSNLIKVDDK